MGLQGSVGHGLGLEGILPNMGSLPEPRFYVPEMPRSLAGDVAGGVLVDLVRPFPEGVPGVEDGS